MVDTFVVVMPLFYAGVVSLYWYSFFGIAPLAERLKPGVLLVLVTVHILYLLLRTAVFDHPPVTTTFEIMSVLAACITIGYTYIEFRTHARNTGLLILLFALVFQTVSSLFIRDITEVPLVLRSRLLGFHVSAALLGYTAISLSAGYGLLYLLLYHEIKSTRFGSIYKRLPNLETLEKMSNKAEAFGFLMLSVSIAVGLFWLPRAFESFSYWDPKLVGTMVIWCIYAIALAAKKGLSWQGRKTMIFSVVGFGFVFLSMTVINLYMSGFHSFH